MMRRALLVFAMLGFAIFPMATRIQAADGRSFVVFFEEWSAGLDSSALKTIAAAAEAARAESGAAINVTGYADPLGSRQANIYLSETRAQVVTDQLTADGIAAARIQQHAKGKVPYQLTSQESRRVIIMVGGQ